MMFEIYQVKDEAMRDYGFISYKEAVRFDGEDVKRDNYKKVYEFDLESSFKISLDDIYFIFNNSRPGDFKGHSLSVSDVVKTPDGYFYCDVFGWKKLNW